MKGKTVCINGFPVYGTASLIKEFLESEIGEGTIYALKFRKPKKPSPCAFVIVQFTENRFADKLIHLARGHSFTMEALELFIYSKFLMHYAQLNPDQNIQCLSSKIQLYILVL
ncbi:hypothetical protein ZOSMA_121G00810 [Zostera marina]|uniref:RDR1/2-like RRM domain-containing protein n=1 Tax=Zostera marina TaxID=29655 RepID=A0A0K9Q186_ZOSMR|nr:hypothetical protein ZOSMA_121G00810 [Zostera marina]